MRLSSPEPLTHAKEKRPESNSTQTHDCPKNQQLGQALSHNATVGETSSPKVQDILPAVRIDGPRDSLSVYRARRRYQSVPASPQDYSSWLARHEEVQQETARGDTQVDRNTEPGTSGSHDITLPELLQIVEMSAEGGDAHPPLMKCITWNVRGLRDPRRRGVVGRYLREWGADIICLQETMLINSDQRIWSYLGWGGNDTHVCIDASGRSGGILLAWKPSLFDREDIWRGKHVVAARLIHRADGRTIVFASAYGPTNVSNRAELWEDLTQLCGIFPNTALLIGGDFIVTLTPEDRPNDMAGQDPGSARFREILAHLGLGEIGPADQRFTWHGPTSQSRIDRYLYSPKLCDNYALAEVTSLPRPLSDHTPLL